MRARLVVIVLAALVLAVDVAGLMRAVSRHECPPEAFECMNLPLFATGFGAFLAASALGAALVQRPFLLQAMFAALSITLLLGGAAFGPLLFGGPECGPWRALAGDGCGARFWAVFPAALVALAAVAGTLGASWRRAPLVGAALASLLWGGALLAWGDAEGTPRAVGAGLAALGVACGVGALMMRPEMGARFRARAR